MAYEDNFGGIHSTEEEARRANSTRGAFESGAASGLMVLCGIGFVIMCAVWLIVYNILYLLIFAAAIIVRSVLNRIINEQIANGFLRFLAKLGTLLIVVGTIAFFYYSIVINPKPELPIVAEATVKDNTKIWKSVLSDQEKEKNIVATVEPGGKVQVMGVSSNGSLKIQTADGIVGYMYLSQVEEKESIEPFAWGFFKKMTNFNFTKKPFVIKPGYYSAEGMKKWQDAVTIEYEKDTDFNRFEGKIVTNKEPVILNDLPYYYTFTLKYYTVTDADGQYLRDEKGNILTAYPDHDLNGMYVITSQESFVDEKGVKWIWYGADASAIRSKYP